jgi:acyl-CoA dehydrogenase
MNHEMHEMIAESVQRLFGDLVTPMALEAFAERGSYEGLWKACVDAGLDRATAHEAHGGIGAKFTETATLLHAVGYHAAPVPLSDSLVAHALLASAEIEPPDAGIVVPLILDVDAPRTQHSLTGRATNVSWGGVAQWGVACINSPEGCQTLLVDLRGSTTLRTPRPQMAHEPHADVQLRAAPVIAAARCAMDASQPLLLGALARSAQIVGALERVLTLGVLYANERVQFGKPIAQNQVLQQMLSAVGGHVAAARTAVQVACSTPEPKTFDVAVAKVRAGDAAGVAAATVHQVHGAIGITAEHVLHHFTQRLWAWRAEYGSEAQWARRLGQWAIGMGAEALWPAIVDRRAGTALD